MSVGNKIKLQFKDGKPVDLSNTINNVRETNNIDELITLQTGISHPSINHEQLAALSDAITSRLEELNNLMMEHPAVSFPSGNQEVTELPAGVMVNHQGEIIREQAPLKTDEKQSQMNIIENPEDAIPNILQSDDPKFLRKYFAEVTALIDAGDPLSADLIQIRDALGVRLTELESIYFAEDISFDDLVQQLKNGEELDTEQTKFTYKFMDYVLTLMSEGSVSQDQLSSAESYTDFLKDKAQNEPLNALEHSVLFRFHSLNEMKEAKEEATKQVAKAHEQKVLALRYDRNAAFIRSVVIIEVAIVLGILIAIIALVRS